MGWENALPWWGVAFAIGYLCGSIAFGTLIARTFGLGDLRQIGSGNIGATNVLRTGSKAAAALTLVADMAKGFLPVWYFLGWGDLSGQIAGIGAVIGHCLPVWLWFRGGKGVATFLGVMLGLSLTAGALVCATWLAAAALFRISSLSALIAAASAPVWLWALDGPRAVLCAACLAVFVCARHHQNIGRLLRGSEPRIGGDKRL
ncbi:MAG: glycerol-3-phosphate 1-O-acyltransferase PlsY [Pseudomonadota bacterium]